MSFFKKYLGAVLGGPIFWAIFIIFVILGGISLFFYDTNWYQDLASNIAGLALIIILPAAIIAMLYAWLINPVKGVIKYLKKKFSK